MHFKKVALFLLCFVLIACQAQKPAEYPESQEPFTVHLFYSKTCPHCKQMRENFIPMVEADFKDLVTIELHDIDEAESMELFDHYIGQYDPETGEWVKTGVLQDVDPDSALGDYLVPLFVVEGGYAFMGYTDSLKESYLQDLHLYRQNRPLSGGDVAKGRWLFKK